MSHWTRAALIIALGVPGLLAQQAPDPIGQGKPLSEWMRLARTGDQQGRRNALWALGQMGADAAPAVPLIVEMLAEPYTLFAIRALADLGPTEAPALPQLNRLLDQELTYGDDSAYLWEIPIALSRFGSAARPRVKILLNDKRSLARQVGLVALRNAEHLEPEDRRVVKWALQDRSPAVRERAREVLKAHPDR